MDVDAFTARHQASWDRLDELARAAGRTGRGLGAEEVDELVALYQRTSSHLARARATSGDRQLVARLTRSVAGARAAIYTTRPRPLATVTTFFTRTFPAAVYEGRRFLVASALLLLGPALAIGVWLTVDGRALSVAVPDEARAVLVDEQFEDYYSSAPAEQFAALVTVNNIRVSALVFVLGALLCLPAAVVLAYNGANVGVVAAAMHEAGRAEVFWGLITPHGLLELTAVVVAGAAGLRLGWAVIAPGDRGRGEALADEALRSVPVVGGLVVWFVVAGLIEGFVTPSELPTAVRVGIGVAAWAAAVLWVWVGGRAAAAEGLTGRLGERPASAGPGAAPPPAGGRLPRPPRGGAQSRPAALTPR